MDNIEAASYHFEAPHAELVRFVKGRLFHVIAVVYVGLQQGFRFSCSKSSSSEAR